MLSSDGSVVEPHSPVQTAPALVTLAPQVKPQSISPLKSLKIRQDGRYEKEGKRWIRRRDNSRFAANPHVVKPAASDFGVYSSIPRSTFPKPLPPFLPRHLSAPSAFTPSRDPASSNAGRYTLSLKGVRRDLRKSGPRSEQIVLDIEDELTQWLDSGGVILSPDQTSSLAVISGKPLGKSNAILEISRSPTELVWRVDEDFPRFILHCVARFYGVVSFSKAASENDTRLTHLLRPNVTRPDFMAAGTLDTPPASDLETFSVIVDTEDSDVASDLGNPLGAEAGDVGRRSPLSVLHEEYVGQDTSLPREEFDHIETDSSVGENDEELSWSIDSLSLTTPGRRWEQTPISHGARDTSSPSRSPSRPFRRTPRRIPPISARTIGDDKQRRFWNYVFA